ncbi:MAG: S49 family peptidase [bacterium]|nr:S49 family peptidase [bacterium]
MPNWEQVKKEINSVQNPHDTIRRKYLKVMNEYTGRNVIAYYSAFIQKPGISGTGIDDSDKNAFMQAAHGLNRELGLDLILHTPGGNVAATESLVYYLKSLFGNNIRVFVPQMAMSAGTMIALAAREIVMGKQSNLGPIDPQYGGMSCAAVLEEFDTALEDIKKNPQSAHLWSNIIGKYHPTFLGDCRKAIEWSEEIVMGWLKDNMFADSESADVDASRVVAFLSSHNNTYSHSRHIHSDALEKMGVNIVKLEGLNDKAIGGCKDLQDCVLTIHHSYMDAFASSRAIKIVENHIGAAMVTNYVNRE